MRKASLSILLISMLFLSSCSEPTSEISQDSEQKMITYQSEKGPVQVPAQPKRVVVLSQFTGNVLSLGVTLVGVDSWAKQNPNFSEQLTDVAEVSADHVEKIIELNPDLVIGSATDKNINRISEMVPTVTFTYGKVDYLQQHIEIGKLLNKEKEAREWVEDFKIRTQQAGKQIKAKIGEDATVSVIENFEKQLYVYGDNWGRGTEILYQAMKLNMPKKVKETVQKNGYYAISPEVLPEFAGDYMILSKDTPGDNAFQHTGTYQNIPAVKNGQVFEADATRIYFNDPITLDYQLEFIKKHFLK